MASLAYIDLLVATAVLLIRARDWVERVRTVEFEVMSGAIWENLQAVRAAYPNVDDYEQGVELALHGAMLNLLYSYVVWYA
ncbi:hypothetical protein GCM10008955_38140 [Deinococcus malanensis]|uniref:Uncharacterized protein n=1 Tax=Deinococcus malanensis TaxID=1706855 RepID=A0ABQ2F520_9DEIO|nr:hypothetical protein [Deinococcus malanensis]GGK40762.1 hypothetical protein GCM10008955_38140 [Deinococcus malanensis]